MESKYACPAGEFKPWHLNLKVGKIVVVIFLVLIGLFFLILGTKFSAFTLTIIFGACLSLLLYTLLKTTIKMHIGSKSYDLISNINRLFHYWIFNSNYDPSDR